MAGIDSYFHVWRYYFCIYQDSLTKKREISNELIQPMYNKQSCHSRTKVAHSIFTMKDFAVKPLITVYSISVGAPLIFHRLGDNNSFSLQKGRLRTRSSTPFYATTTLPLSRGSGTTSQKWGWVFYQDYLHWDTSIIWLIPPLLFSV